MNANELKEWAAQQLADMALKESEQIVEKDGVVELDVTGEFNGYVFALKIYKKKDENRFADQAAAKRGATKSTPYILAKLWHGMFKDQLGYEYSKGGIMPKELGLMKNMLKEYDVDLIKRMMAAYLKHYTVLPKHDGPPTVAGMMGYRKYLAHKVINKEAWNINRSDMSDVGIKL